MAIQHEAPAIASEENLAAPTPLPKASPLPPTPEQITIIKSTAPLMGAHGEAITTLFYKNMITAHPALNNMFNRTGQTTGAQPRALAGAVFAFANYVDQLEDPDLQAAVAKMTHKHASLGVQAEQYDIVGHFLLQAVETILGSDVFTGEVKAAWERGYAMLAGLLIGIERSMYADMGAWTSWRKFKIDKKVVESTTVTSFYLAPEDKKGLPMYQPGQYTSLRIFVPEMGYMQPRQYSLSDAPGKPYYRISVKKDIGAPGGDGLVSNILHEKYQEGATVELTHPVGEFFVDVNENSDGPLVLISAGVGVTPMVSILNSLLEAKSSRSISWIQGSHDTDVRPFTRLVREICEHHDNVHSVYFNSSVKESEIQGIDHHYVGRVDLSKLDGDKDLFLSKKAAKYYICGPLSFMVDVKDWLLRAGIDASRVNLERFGVGSVQK